MTEQNGIQTAGVKREIYRRRLLEARAAYCYGSETLDELAVRFQLDKGDLTRASRSQGWPTMRKNKHDEMARRLEARTAIALVDRRDAFLGDAAKLVNKLGDLLDGEADRIKQGMPNASGLLPTFADTALLAKSILNWVNAGKAAFAIQDEINLPKKKRSSMDIIDIEPMSAAGNDNPFAIEAPEPPRPPIE